jgi:hypothetical protein
LGVDVSPEEEAPQDDKDHVDNVVPSKVKIQIEPTQARGRSERLMKEVTLTTEEKNERMAKKRNLEGIAPNQNMFSVLPVDEILDLATNMGIVVDSSDFGPFDLLKYLECARHDLFVKQKENDSIPQTKIVGWWTGMGHLCRLSGSKESNLMLMILSWFYPKRKLGRIRKN